LGCEDKEKNSIFFADDNIVANKKFARELFRALKPYNVNWMCITEDVYPSSSRTPYPFFHVLVHFLSFLLRKRTVAFAAYATAKKRPFSQKFPGSAAVSLRPYTRRGFAPPFTVVFFS
jgi:hypothetical protein